MKITIGKSTPRGAVTAPPSKSMAHRLLICAGLAQGKSIIRGVEYSQDILATLDCLQALGVQVEREGSTVYVTGTNILHAQPAETLNCRESGSTLRFFIPIALLCGNQVRLTGSEKLLSRPLSVYEELKEEKGFRFEADASGVTVQGPLPGGDIQVDGSISSQFISGLLFALPLIPAAGAGSRLHIRKPIESKNYIDMTVSALESFGVCVQQEEESTFAVAGGQTYRSGEFTVEGDYSNAAFFAAMNALGGDVAISGLREDSLQGDKSYQEYLRALRQGFSEIDISQCPDLGPVLFMSAAALHGGVFTGTRRLRIKESDRANAMAQELAKCGGSILVEENRVIIEKTPLHAPVEAIDGHNDHRIVMAMSVLLTCLGGSIQGAEAVRKSYPGFFDALSALGVRVQKED